MEMQTSEELRLLREIDARLQRMVSRQIRAMANGVLIASIVGLLLWPLAIFSLLQTFPVMKLIKEEGSAGSQHKGKVIAAMVISIIGLVLLVVSCVIYLLLYMSRGY